MSTLSLIFELSKSSHVLNGSSCSGVVKFQLFSEIRAELLSDLQETLNSVECFTEQGTKIPIQDSGVIPESSIIAISGLPRSSYAEFVGDDLDDLLKEGEACIREPSEFLLLKIDQSEPSFFCSLSSEPPPKSIESYRAAQFLFQKVELMASHELSTTMPKSFVLFDTYDLVLKPSYKHSDLNSEFPMEDLKSFFGRSDQQPLRKEVFIGTLCDFLKDIPPGQMAGRLLKDHSGDQFVKRLNSNFKLCQKDLRVDERLKGLRSELSDLSERVAKIVLGLEAKALAIPGAIIVSAKVIGVDGGWSLANSAVFVGLVLLSLVTSAAFFAQKSISSALLEDIEDLKKRAIEEASSSSMEKRLKSLKNRIEFAKYVKLLVVILSWSLCYFTWNFMSKDSPEPTTDDANTLQIDIEPVVEPPANQATAEESEDTK